MRRLSVLVFVVGAGTLGSEIAAARLLAPYFGDSTLIWANTIGVVLVALSIGYAVGGRLADRHPHERGLRTVVLVAAVLLALVPIVAGPFLDLAVTGLDRIEVGAFVGSLVGMLVLFAVPLLIIGACSPWAVRLAVGDVEEAGTVTGRLYAISTAGSLVGTFMASLVLIPFVGTQRTFLVFALVIALAAAVGLSRRWAVVPAVVALMLLLPPGVTKPAEDGDRVVAEEESSYQYARVVQRGTGRTAERRLELNEGQAVHSFWRPDTVLTGNYWDAYQVLPFAVLAGPEQMRRFAMLGNAGGTVARAALHLYPDVRYDGVEIDGRVSELGRRWLGMPSDDPRLRIHTQDARPFLRSTLTNRDLAGAGTSAAAGARVPVLGGTASGAPTPPASGSEDPDAPGRFDVIGVDAYRQPYIPFYLTTREFFTEARSRLARGGAVIVNVGHPEGSDKLERALAATLRRVFPSVLRYAISDTNVLLVASVAPGSADRLRAAIPRLPAEVRATAELAANGLRPALTGGPVYTDDRAPVEWLVDGSILGYAANGD